MRHTLVTFHAHPDDEALLTAGVMAKAAAEGHRVVLVVATRGEVGLVASDFLGDRDLGSTRMAELHTAAEAIGVHRVELLGYSDSGVDGTAARSRPDPRTGAEPSPARGASEPRADLGPFARAPVEDAASRLAEILREEHADVLTIYDPNGGYQHPDHVQVHRVGARAAAMAGTPVVLEATINRDLMKMGVELAGSLGYELPPEYSPATFDDWYLPQDQLTHAVDVTAFLDNKRAAMAAHASQTTGDEGARSLAMFLAIPDEHFAMAFGTEWFVDRNLEPGIASHDIFAGI